MKFQASILACDAHVTMRLDPNVPEGHDTSNFILKMEVPSPSETLVSCHITIRCNNSECCDFIELIPH
jgi:hypothetical protein